jgi:hypothetical protein
VSSESRLFLYVVLSIRYCCKSIVSILVVVVVVVVVILPAPLSPPRGVMTEIQNLSTPQSLNVETKKVK